MKATLPALVLLASLAAAPALAEPRFAARLAVPCSACHVNPTGGGLRTAFGRDVFEKQQLTWEPGAGLQRALDFDPRIGDLLAFGSDFRLAMIAQPTRKETDPPPATYQLLKTIPTPFTFFPMQADLYVGAEISRHVALYADIGANGSYEAFGLVRNLPGGLYVKAGYFIPPYGTKLPNHTAAHRQPIGFDPRGKDAGLELGMTLPFLDAQIAVQNGDLGSTLDTRRGLAVSGRAALMHDFGLLRATAGPSARCAGSMQQVSLPSGQTIPTTSVECQEGGFLWLSMGRFTWLQEVDVHVMDDASTLTSEGKPVRAGQLVSYQELGFLPMRGVDLGLTYEFMDRDIYGTSDPADVVHRFGVQAALFPVPYVETQLFVRTYRARADREENGQWEVIAFLHLFF